MVRKTGEFRSGPDSRYLEVPGSDGIGRAKTGRPGASLCIGADKAGRWAGPLLGLRAQHLSSEFVLANESQAERQCLFTQCRAHCGPGTGQDSGVGCVQALVLEVEQTPVTVTVWIVAPGNRGRVRMVECPMATPLPGLCLAPAIPRTSQELLKGGRSALALQPRSRSVDFKTRSLNLQPSVLFHSSRYSGPFHTRGSECLQSRPPTQAHPEPLCQGTRGSVSLGASLG